MTSSDTARLSRRRSTALKGPLVAGLLLAGITTAHAQTYSETVLAPFTTEQTFNSNTTTAGTPTFNESFVGGGTAVPYNSDLFTAPTGGVYQFSTTVTSGYSNAANFVQFLYSPTFSAASPKTNNVGFVQPASGANTISYSEQLSANQQFTIVDGGIVNTDVGTTTTTIALNNTAIPDNSTAGNSQIITVANTTTITSFNSITIDGLSHPFIGDLVATLTHTGTNGTTSVDLFDHVNANNNPSSPGYNYGQGSAASFDGNNYTFALTGASLSAVPDFTPAPDGTTYMASGNAATGFDTANAANTLNSFLGQSEAGTWTLSIKDEQLDDTGSFTGFSFTVNQPAAAPEPSQYAAFGIGLLGLGALALRARRRKTA